MLTDFGFGEVEVNGEIIAVNPTFNNVSKIGTPAEVVDYINELNMFLYAPITNFRYLFTGLESQFWRWTAHKYLSALTVLKCFLDKDLPLDVYGDIAVTKNGIKLKLGRLGEDGINDVCTLAAHCLKHACLGNDVIDEFNESSEPMTEFKASEFITLATTHFKMNYEEAGNLSMTQFCERMKAEYPEQHKELEEKRKKAKQEAELLRWCNDMGL